MDFVAVLRWPVGAVLIYSFIDSALFGHKDLASKSVDSASSLTLQLVIGIRPLFSMNFDAILRGCRG